MPIAPVPVPTYPSVPMAPGVPPLLRVLNQPTAIVVEVESDFLKVASLFLGPQWGLFDATGRVALIADSVNSFEFKREWRCSSYPIEMGGFQSYNKVEIPYDVKIMFSIGQTPAARTAFLAQVDAICASTTLYSAGTPEALYPTLSPYNYDYRRETKNGATLLKVDVWCLKIRQSAVSTYSNTQQPSGADPVQGGSVQPGSTLQSAADYTNSFQPQTTLSSAADFTKSFQ